MSNDRTLPVTPAERAAAPMLRAWQAWKPDMTDRGPVHHMLVMFGTAAATADLVDAETDDLTPAGAALLARVEAAERTPETVLRAMLVSYGAAAIELRTELWRSPAWPPLFARQLDVLDHAITTLHNAIGAHLAASPRADESLMSLGRLVRTDYAARLAGTTPIAAPPAKEPR